MGNNSSNWVKILDVLMNILNSNSYIKPSSHLWLMLAAALIFWLVAVVWAYTSLGIAPIDTQTYRSGDPSPVSSLELIALEDSSAASIALATTAESVPFVKPITIDRRARPLANNSLEASAALYSRTEDEDNVDGSLIPRTQSVDSVAPDSTDQPLGTTQPQLTSFQTADEISVPLTSNLVQSTEQAASTAMSYAHIEVLSQLSDRSKFPEGSAQMNSYLQTIVDRMIDTLDLYLEVPVSVIVSSNELVGAAANSRLSRDRGQAIVNYLVDRGLQSDRFWVFVEPGDALPFGTHHVKVVLEGLN